MNNPSAVIQELLAEYYSMQEAYQHKKLPNQFLQVLMRKYENILLGINKSQFYYWTSKYSASMVHKCILNDTTIRTTTTSSTLS